MRRSLSLRTSWFFLSALILVSAATLFAQQPATNESSKATENQPPPDGAAIQGKKPAFEFQTERNLILVRVVVLDSKGKAVGNLQKSDFKLYDNGKLQDILQFSAENADSKVEVPGATPGRQAPEQQSLNTSVPPPPGRFLGLFFDDVHMETPDILRMQAALHKFIDASTIPGDRIGLFTSSGQGDIDFTQDRAALDKGISSLMSRPLIAKETRPCPNIYPFQAYQIVEQQDKAALDEATLEVLKCQFDGDSSRLSTAQYIAQSKARETQEDWQQQSENVLREIDNLVRRMSVLPGERNMVVISPGFLTLTEEFDLDQIADHALRSEVTIGTLDGRGLATNNLFGGIDENIIILPDRPDLMGKKALIKENEYQEDAEVLEDLAADTGGFYFHNNNDLLSGLHRTASLVSTSYILAYSPQFLKPNGQFHRLAVKVANSEGYTVEARRGYFAPRESADATEQAEDEIRQTVLSQNEVLQLPIDVHTQYFMMDEHNARLAILTHLDLRPVPFHKAEGRNLENLTFVTALFDNDGHYVTGKETHIDFHLLDANLQQLISSGLTVKNSFDVKPGIYMIRQVVRDARGGQISGVSSTVQIAN